MINSDRVLIRYKEVYLICYLCITIISTAVSWIISDSIFVKSALSVLFLIGLFPIIRKETVPDCILVLAVVGLSFLVSFWNHPEYAELYSSKLLSRILLVNGGFFGYLVFRQFSNQKMIFSALKISSIILTIVYSIIFILYLRGSTGVDSMDIAYTLIVPCLCFMYMCFYTKYKFTYGFLSVYLILIIFVCGVRGAFICVAFFIACLILKAIIDAKDAKTRFLIFLKLLLLIGALTVFYLVLARVSQRFYNAGFDFRIMTQLVNGELGDSNGRIIIWKNVLKLIKTSPWTGLGALSDQYNLVYFSHNIFLEMLVTYGLIIGSVIILFLIILFGKSFVCLKKENFYLFVIFLSASLPRLLVSNSFWYDYNFWITIAISMNMLLAMRLHGRKKVAWMQMHTSLN